MKSLIITAVFFAMTNQGKAQLPQCLIKRMAVGYDYSQIRVALLKKDTCYVIDRRTWDPSKISRHEIFMITSKRGMPEYVQPEVYDKKCKPVKFLKNKDLIYTSKIYSWTEIYDQLKTIK